MEYIVREVVVVRFRRDNLYLTISLIKIIMVNLGIAWRHESVTVAQLHGLALWTAFAWSWAKMVVVNIVIIVNMLIAL